MLQGEGILLQHLQGICSQTYPQALHPFRGACAQAVRIVRVALDVPLDEAFDFRLADGVEAPPGTLVIVPFGRTRKVGVVVAQAAHTDVPPERLRAV